MKDKKGKIFATFTLKNKTGQLRVGPATHRPEYFDINFSLITCRVPEKKGLDRQTENKAIVQGARVPYLEP